MKAILWYNNKRCRVSKDEFKTLNGSIVPTCWDGCSLHTFLMDATYVSVEVVPLPMRLWQVSRALMKPRGAWPV
jgi:hypothetical protein